jgi:hypothetical protein
VLQAPASGVPEVDNEQLVLFYFTHDGSKTYIQIAEITQGQDGRLVCDRNKYIATTAMNQPTSRSAK